MTQYKRMERWAKGKFDADWPGAEPLPSPSTNCRSRIGRRRSTARRWNRVSAGLSFRESRPAGVCSIETTYDKQRPFRINAKLPPGALTAGMAVPWQADFNDCNSEDGADWWPGQRPNEVRRGQDIPMILRYWTPIIGSSTDMVKSWSQLGFVVERRRREKSSMSRMNVLESGLRA